MSQGKVYLVGAGPGDPGLITRRGLECLRKADVVVYDRLIDDSLLDEAPPQAEKIYVGKNSGHHSLPQSEINNLLVKKALQGSTVVRLKGGDPFVFGRGGEETEALAKAGISFSIVPGITSAIAVPAYAGIPVTHRRVASSFAVVTGHEDILKDTSQINWDGLATGPDTIIFLMGVANLSFITSQLIAHGRKPQTPAAIITNGTTPAQFTITATLGEIADVAQSHGITPPSILIVGETVNLRAELAWFDNRPLFGRKILLTRPKAQMGPLKSLLIEEGAEVFECPMIEIRPADPSEIDSAIDILKETDWVFFTSANGVEAFFNHLYQRGLDGRILYHSKVGAIGPATAEALKKRGIITDFIPHVYTTDGILEDIKTQGVKGKKVLLLRADIADERLVRGLEEAGASVKVVAAYSTVPVKYNPEELKELLISNKIDVVTFTSASTVKNFVKSLGKHAELLNKVLIASIGPVTSEAAIKLGLRVDVEAKEQTIAGLVEAIINYYSEVHK